MVVPGLLVVEGEMPRMVGLEPAPPACVVVMMVVGFPSAEVTSFNMVPAGRGPFVWEGEKKCQVRHHDQPTAALMYTMEPNTQNKNIPTQSGLFLYNTLIDSAVNDHLAVVIWNPV